MTLRDNLDSMLAVWSAHGDAPMTDQARTVAAFALRWAAANARDPNLEGIVVTANDLTAIADELEGVK